MPRELDCDMMGTFFGCESLEDIVIPQGVRNIEYPAFCYCSGLKSIVLPLGLESIAANAFNGCSKLKSVTIKTTLLTGTKGSGRAMCFITGANAERTFADYMGAALELVPEDLKSEYFEGYDYFHIEGYLVQNQDLIRRAVQMAKEAGCKISIDMASYNVVESNEAFFHNLVEKYVDIVFANESEARAYTKLEPREALDALSQQCEIAVVKVGKDGSMVKQGDEYHYIEAWPAATIDATGAGDTYAAGFIYAHSLGMPLRVCGEVGSIIAAKVVEVIGTKIDVPRWRDAKLEIRELIASVNK
jgi:sugar/nucleoside kinase (ribokinase family)